MALVRQFYAWSRTYEKLETHALEAEVGTCGRGMELGVRRIFVFFFIFLFYLRSRYGVGYGEASSSRPPWILDCFTLFLLFFDGYFL